MKTLVSAQAMTDSIPNFIQDWCVEQGYTDPHLVELHWRAFPPNAVMSVPIQPNQPDSRTPYFAGGISRSHTVPPWMSAATAEAIHRRVYENMMGAQSITFEEAAQAVEVLSPPDCTVTFPTPRSLNVTEIRAIQRELEEPVTELGSQFAVIVKQLQQTLLTAFKVPIEVLQRHASGDAETCQAYLSSRYRMPTAIAHARIREFQQRHSLDDAEILRLLKTGKIIVSC